NSHVFHRRRRHGAREGAARARGDGPSPHGARALGRRPARQGGKPDPRGEQPYGSLGGSRLRREGGPAPDVAPRGAHLGRGELLGARGARKEDDRPRFQAPLPGTALVHQLLTALEASGRAEDGTQALLTVYESLGGGR